jgi:hypothetical protein
MRSSIIAYGRRRGLTVTVSQREEVPHGRYLRAPAVARRRGTGCDLLPGKLFTIGLTRKSTPKPVVRKRRACL